MSKAKPYGCIYKHTNLIKEGWSYIGQTTYNVGSRWKENGHGYQKSFIFRRAIDKYGWDNFSHEIIENNVPIDKLDEREQYWIKFYHTYVGDPECKGYNMTIGGNVGRGRICREETKQKTSNALLGHSVSEHVAKRVSECSKGKSRPLEVRKKKRLNKANFHTTKITPIFPFFTIRLFFNSIYGRNLEILTIFAVRI